ncbi:amino acid ABC transporter substrate-binding protein [Mesobacillus foraminis]|uniref:Cystine transport system substrate-binding protein n=1 Tax=Mesobacillus foraminis TaxID=279826 RepID=A0A4R2BJC6_9BACI|nr:amino acid ABC transporter substrate-binding protein [Mesobacillus foraminis]TCN27287.1 cystine transport system substrate-binding protein [Mesobacillus foraminis]
MRKYNILLALLMSVSLLISGCGNNENNEAGTDKEQNNTGDPAQEDGENLLAKVEQEGKLLIGTEGTYPPFTFHGNNGKLTGFDVEVAGEVAKRLNVKAEFLETQWDAMFAGLDAKRFDMVANQVGIRPDREEKYAFSKPYITSTAVLITHEENKDIVSFEDIKGKKAAQSMTSNYADIARNNEATIVGVDGFNQAIELLLSKRADVTINDNITYLDFKKSKPDAAVKIVAKSEDASRSGFMFRQGSEELVDKVNEALQSMIEDGTYEKISQKWFGENVLE